MAWLIQHRVRKVSFVCTHISKSPRGKLPRGSPRPPQPGPLLTQSVTFSKGNSYLAPGWREAEDPQRALRGVLRTLSSRPACSPEPDTGLAAVLPTCHPATFIHRAPSPPPRPPRSHHHGIHEVAPRSRSSPLLSLPRQNKTRRVSNRFFRHARGGMPARSPRPGVVINSPTSSAAPVQPGTSAGALQRCQTCKQVRCIELQGEGSYYGTPGPRHSHPY